MCIRLYAIPALGGRTDKRTEIWQSNVTSRVSMRSIMPTRDKNTLMKNN